MDLLCPKCGEPWDIDSLHDEAESQGTTFSRIAKRFCQIGCAVFEGVTCVSNDDVSKDTLENISAIYDLLGDDMDGAASFLEDFDLA